MLCDRYDIFDAYQHLLQATIKPGTERLMLAISARDSTPGVGKTRILEEIAVHSIYDGFVPCIIPARSEMPASFLEFAVNLADAIDATREHLELELDWTSLSRHRAFEFANMDVASPDPLGQLMKAKKAIRERSAEARSLDSKLILDAVRRDCGQLVKELAAKTVRSHWPLVLIDEFHRCDGAIELVLSQITAFGLGTANMPIPVVINYVSSAIEASQISEKINVLPLERRREIRPFASGVEQKLVYSQLVLSEYLRVPSPRRDQREQVNGLWELMHETTGGLPGKFLSVEVRTIVQSYEKMKFLVTGGPEDILRRSGI